MLKASENAFFIGLLDVSGGDDFFDDVVGLVEVEDDVELADTAEVPVETLDEVMNHFESDQFVFFLVTERDEVQRSVPLIDDFILPVLQEVAQPTRTAYNHHCNFSHVFRPIRYRKRPVPLYQSDFALSIYEH